MGAAADTSWSNSSSSSSSSLLSLDAEALDLVSYECASPNVAG
jgi:hypothetical protein